jgi:hypothetical protein
VSDSIGGSFQAGLNSLVILGAWSLWRHLNDCVFNGARTSISSVMIMVFKAVKRSKALEHRLDA